MEVRKNFRVFGERVDVLFTSFETGGSFSMVVQTCPPGGGPPPHIHEREDEIFLALEGEFELFDGKHWTRMPIGEYVYGLRGNPHTFRNRGNTTGKIQVIIVPGKLDTYLEALSALTMPQEAPKLMEISREYGVRFVTSEIPHAAP